ncbi:MAG: HPr-rel-A system PqqD family peptide chaperone [Gemmatimonadetes bacterium]|nr:HPr-rel-A system PqqD family peptide chaperone [Gemmatimonadota bacterium]
MSEGGGGSVHAPRARPDVVFRSVAGDWVLYDPRTQDLHVLNVTAAAVWACCDGTLDPGAIAREVAEHLEGAPSPDEVRADVERALERFRADGLLE